MVIHEWWRSMVKGRIVACIRGNDDPERVAKGVGTFVRRGRIAAADLQPIFEEVKRESVEPFAGSPWNQPERQSRFAVLMNALVVYGAEKGGSQ